MHFRCLECGNAALHDRDTADTLSSTRMCAFDGYMMVGQPIWQNCKIEKVYTDSLSSTDKD